MMSKFLATAFGGNDVVMRLMAIQAGFDARKQAASIGHQAIWGLESNGSTEIALLRGFSVIGQLPLAIAKAIAASGAEQTEVKVSAMQLNAQEYPGTLPRMLDAGQPDPSLLQFAGEMVFWHLRMSGLEPKLEYVYDGDTRTYSLDIVVTVQVGKN